MLFFQEKETQLFIYIDSYNDLWYLWSKIAQLMMFESQYSCLTFVISKQNPLYCLLLCKQPLHQKVKHPTHEWQKLVWAENIPSTSQLGKLQCSRQLKPQTFPIERRPRFKRNSTSVQLIFAGKTSAVEYTYSKCTRYAALCVAQLGLQVGRQKAGKERFAARRMLVMRRLISQHSWMARQKACYPLIVRCCYAGRGRVIHRAGIHTSMHIHKPMTALKKWCTQHTLGPTYSHHTIAPRLALSIKSSHTISQF